MPTDEEEYEYCLEQQRPNYKYGVLMTKLEKRYAEQYAEKGCLEYLFKSSPYWAVMQNDGKGITATFSNLGEIIYDSEYITVTQEMIEYLKEKSQLEHELLARNEKFVSDVKVFSAVHGLTLLYIKGY